MIMVHYRGSGILFGGHGTPVDEVLALIPITPIDIAARLREIKDLEEKERAQHERSEHARSNSRIAAANKRKRR